MSDVTLEANVILALSEPGRIGGTHQPYCGNDARNRCDRCEAAHSWALKNMQDLLGANVVGSAIVEEAPS